MHFPISIGVHRSRFLRRALLLLGLLALGFAGLYPGALWSRLLFAGFTALFFLQAWRSLPQDGERIILQAPGTLCYLRAGQSVVEPQVPQVVLPGTKVHPYLSVLHLKASDGSRQFVLLLPDSLTPADFRRLRVFLRWQAALSADATGSPAENA